jgi:hypothetical protein
LKASRSERLAFGFLDLAAKEQAQNAPSLNRHPPFVNKILKLFQESEG